MNRRAEQRNWLSRSAPCGCAADSSALMQSATLRPRWLWAESVHQQAIAEEASAVLVSMRCGRSSARRALHKQGHARPRAMARDIRNHRAIATRVLS